ncbi:hypothetical protein [Nonomuraea maritima]|uniref:hypothetical protein n=1 Tax=Nonomuraea maritima TaxID=683260 RepID=UPI000B82A2CF|nr:hypothetical protein [Nonomuraea maritima]
MEIEPGLLREPPGRITAHVAEAVDAAFRRARSADGDAALVEPLALARELRAVRAGLDARMARVTATIEASLASTRTGTHVGAAAADGEAPGGVPVMDFGELFGPLVEVLETIGAVPDDDVRGVSGGPVRAVCAPGPRLVSLHVPGRALHGGPAQVGARVVTAVNAALDDLETGLRRRHDEAGAGTERIRATVEELRELGVARMRAYIGGMAGLMAGIRPEPGSR